MFVSQPRRNTRICRAARGPRPSTTTSEVSGGFVPLLPPYPPLLPVDSTFPSSAPLRGGRRDFLQPGRHHHPHRDDRRGLVEGRVSWAHRAFPSTLRPAAVGAAGSRSASLQAVSGLSRLALLSLNDRTREFLLFYKRPPPRDRAVVSSSGRLWDVS